MYFFTHYAKLDDDYNLPGHDKTNYTRKIDHGDFNLWHSNNGNYSSRFQFDARFARWNEYEIFNLQQAEMNMKLIYQTTLLKEIFNLPRTLKSTWHLQFTAYAKMNV